MMQKITEHEVSGETIKVWHPQDNEGYSIYFGSGGWMTGTYDSVESALIGAECDLKLIPEFYEMQKRVNYFDKENRLITVDDFEFLKAK